MKYAFDQYVLDVSTRELRQDNAVLSIEPKVLDLLCYLIQNRDRVVSKDELVERVWNRRIVSDAAVSSAVSAARRALDDDGRQQRYLKTAHGHGFRFVASISESGAKTSRDAPLSDTPPEQRIGFCESADGARIAYGVAGEGPTLIKASNWLTHLEYDWESPVWRHFYSALAQGRRLVRYDSRGNGLSDWTVTDHSFDRQVEDLEAVIDVAGTERISIIGLCQGCTSAVAFAARNPERVEKLVLLGGYVRGWRARGETDGYVLRKSAHDALPLWWGKETAAIRDLFSGIYMPDAPVASRTWFSDLQRKTATPENASAMMFSDCDDDISDLLSQVQAPTLVLHAVGDLAAPYEEGKALATGIPGAQFISLETANHIIPESDPEWHRCAQKIDDFLSTGG